MRSAVLLLAGAALLSGCDRDSSGGGTPSPTPTPAANLAPTFWTPDNRTVEARENVATTIYTVVAKDPEGAAITYSVSGGPDAQLFAIDAAGALSFKTPPDFEAPADSNQNNLYNIEITASDGSASAVQRINILVVDLVDEYPLHAMGRVWTGAERMTNYVNFELGAVKEDAGGFMCFDIANAKGDARLCGGGTLHGSVDTSDFSNTDERGLLGLVRSAVRPSLTGLTLSGSSRLAATTGLAAIALYTAANGDIVITWLFKDGLGGYQPLSDLPPIWRIPSTATRNLAGWLAFGPDGYLYIGLGDGENPAAAQDPASPFGKVLRIDVTRDDFPADANRMFGVPASGMIVAMGLRNPFRASVEADGNVIIGDRGASQREEINLVRAGESAVNFGWPYFEGSLQRQAGGPAGMRAPTIELEHGTGPLNANGIVGGFVYNGGEVPLRGNYIFGDSSGRLWMLPYTRLLAGGVTSADLIRGDGTISPPGRLPASVFSFAKTAQNDMMLIDDTGFYYLIN